MGNWMTSTASLWLVYHLSSSPFMLGLVGFASLAPMFFLAPFAGVFVDRVNRHRLFLTTQSCAMLQSFALATFALTGTIDVTHIIVLCLIQGVIDAFDMPTRQALVIEFVERKEHLGNAIGLNSSMFNLARLAGPAIAGFVIAGYGAGACYLLDGLSYLAVIIALLNMRLAPRPISKARAHPWTEFRDGVRYAYKYVPVRGLITLIACISATGFSYSVLMPLFARDVFHGDARTLGWLMSATGVGAVTGALYLSSRKSVRGLGHVITAGGTLLGCGVIGFALSHWIAMALGCLLLVGMGGVLTMASSNTLIQTLVDDDKRGRVMSIFATAFTGTMPLGNLAAGALAAKFGAFWTLIVSGTFSLLIISIFWRNLPKLRAAAAEQLAKHEASLVEPVLPAGG